MSSIARMAFLLLVMAVPLAFADVGPAPSPPRVTVRLMDGGQPASGISLITYHCMGVDDAEPGSVNPYPVDFPCSSGVCSNSGDWYYKFNPCFKFPEGHFTYQYAGKEVRTEAVGDNKSYDNYDITVDAPTGQVSGNTGSSCNLAGAILPLVLLGTAAFGAAGRK
ncbi:hypothetical protein L0Y65_04720 [Candidatus Micrarchaeota archaeon]|nr:hypothetical protein [Candidatus Micrarchaeota archaeon]